MIAFLTILLMCGDVSISFDPQKCDDFRLQDSSSAFLQVKPEQGVFPIVIVEGEKHTQSSIENALKAVGKKLQEQVKEGQLFLTLGTDRVVLQKHENACAATSLFLLLTRIGIPMELSEIEAGLDPGPTGKPKSLLEIKIYVEDTLGLKGEGYSGQLKDLRDLDTPVILHVDGHHYVVLSYLTEFGGVILDPAMGRQFWSNEMLSKRWGGIYFEVQK